jgi:hypothetical protein
MSWVPRPVEIFVNICEDKIIPAFRLVLSKSGWAHSKNQALVGCLKMTRFTYPDNDWQSTWHEEIQGTAVPHLPTLMNMTLDKHGCQALVEVKSMSKM